MSQLIALIIAIALGAIVTAIGFVFLGDAFTKNSERGVALQFVSQASQVEMALTAHRAELATSPTQIASPTATTVFADLTSKGYLKDVIVPPKGSFSLVKDGSKSYLVVDSVDISDQVCLEVERLKNKSVAAAPQLRIPDATPGNGAPITAASGVTGVNLTGNGGLNGAVYGCFAAYGDNNVFAYRVE